VLVLQVLVMAALLLALYGVYRALMASESRATRVLAQTAGTVMAVVTCVLALVVRPMVFESAIVTSSSMMPTLLVGDRVFAGKLAYKHQGPRQGDIVTFRFPSQTPGLGEDVLVKRVIGVPGDVIEIKDGAVYRNGVRLDEPYIREPMEYDMPSLPVTKGKVFVLGDNRNESDDSHVWGLLDCRRVIGRAGMRFWPLSRMGSVK
jgi:signal peptidase I